jgi:hypothetical protein
MRSHCILLTSCRYPEARNVSSVMTLTTMVNWSRPCSRRRNSTGFGHNIMDEYNIYTELVNCCRREHGANSKWRLVKQTNEEPVQPATLSTAFCDKPAYLGYSRSSSLLTSQEFINRRAHSSYLCVFCSSGKRFIACGLGKASERTLTG